MRAELESGNPDDRIDALQRAAVARDDVPGEANARTFKTRSRRHAGGEDPGGSGDRLSLPAAAPRRLSRRGRGSCAHAALRTPISLRTRAAARESALSFSIAQKRGSAFRPQSVVR